MPSDRQFTRRQALRTGRIIATPLLLGGCLSSGPADSTDGRSTRQGTAESAGDRSERTCAEGFTAQGDFFDDVHVSDEIWEMSANPNPVALSERLTIQLKNVSDELARTWGTPSMTAIQFADGNDWTEISYFHDVGWGDPGANHQPGEGWEWTFQVDAESLEEVGKFTICKDLVPGTYRFVYWGISRDGDHYALATEFAVTAK